MKKFIILKKLFTLLVVFSLALSPLLALAETINFNNPSYSTNLNSDFNVTLNIEDAVDVTTAHFILKYDPSLMSFSPPDPNDPFAPSSVTSYFSCPPFFDNPMVSDEEISGTNYRKVDITMDLCDGSGNGFNGDGNLVDIIFHASGTDALDQLEIVSLDPPDLSQVCYSDFDCSDLIIGSPTQITIGNPDLEDPSLSVLSPTTENTYTYINSNNVLNINGTSSDDILIDRIEYNINGESNETAVGTSTWNFDVDLTEGENTIEVIAYDTAGKSSSSTLVVDYSSDIEAPILDNGSPTGALPSGTTQTTLSLTTDEVATCRYSADADVLYDNMTNTMASSSDGLTHSATVNGLTNGSSYTYYIRCQDTLGNTNDSDYDHISFSVSNPPAPSGGGGGGGGRSYTPPPPAPTIALEDPLSVYATTREEDKITLTWENSEADNFEAVVIIRSDDEVLDYLSYDAILELGDKLYEGTEEIFIDTEIEPNLKYYYALFIKYDDDTYSKPLIIQKDKIYNPDEEIIVPELYNSGGTYSDYSDLKSLGGVKSNIVEIVSFNEGQKIYDQNMQVSLNDTTRRLYDLIVNQSPHDLSNQDRYAIAYFIHEGTPTTIILGAGERAGVVNSYLSVFDKLPRSEGEWQDVVKIANGRWPTERSEIAEQAAQNNYFMTIYKRNPDMNNPHDNAAVTVITYGLRPAERSLFNELAAINIFKGIYGEKPSSALDWDITRAIAYSGAVR